MPSPAEAGGAIRVNQQISPDDEIIEFVCNENQQFRKLIKID
jgi:hypothetical protein